MYKEPERLILAFAYDCIEGFDLPLLGPTAPIKEVGLARVATSASPLAVHYQLHNDKIRSEAKYQDGVGSPGCRSLFLFHASVKLMYYCWLGHL